MIQGRFVVFILGIFLSILSVAMAIALMDLLYRDPDWVYFAESATITGFVGILLALGFRSEEEPTFESERNFYFNGFQLGDDFSFCLSSVYSFKRSSNVHRCFF